MKRHLATVACAFALSIGATGVRAQSPNAITLSQGEWTVLTMAPDGSWGVATDLFINRAIADAIRMCRGMSGAQLGCGAVLVSVQAGWSLGLRCGQENILAADRYLENAERIARERELELRYVHAAALGICRRVVTVTPEGRVIAPEQEPQIALPDGRVSGR
ncbi:MAG: hypothetical protein WDO17_17550 [Alphaproteobacteria bacterium]